MSPLLLLAIAAITIGSRVLALAVLPPPQGAAADLVRRLPTALFAAFAALTLVGSGSGAGDPAILVAVGCALLAVIRWRSLLITLAAGLAGFGIAGLIW